MIQIKGLYTPWHEVGREIAAKYARYLLDNLPALSDKQERANYINAHRIRGVTVEELLEE